MISNLWGIFLIIALCTLVVFCVTVRLIYEFFPLVMFLFSVYIIVRLIQAVLL